METPAALDCQGAGSSKVFLSFTCIGKRPPTLLEKLPLQNTSEPKGVSTALVSEIQSGKIDQRQAPNMTQRLVVLKLKWIPLVCNSGEVKVGPMLPVDYDVL